MNRNTLLGILAIFIAFVGGVAVGYWLIPALRADISNNTTASATDTGSAGGTIPLSSGTAPSAQSDSSSPGNNSASAGASSNPPAFQEVVLSGHGQQATKVITLPAGGYRITMTHDGASNFIVIMDDGQGKQLQVLTNQVGKTNTSQVVNVAAGSYLFNVGADGNWTIKIDGL